MVSECCRGDGCNGEPGVCVIVTGLCAPPVNGAELAGPAPLTDTSSVALFVFEEIELCTDSSVFVFWSRVFSMSRSCNGTNFNYLLMKWWDNASWIKLKINQMKKKLNDSNKNLLN